MGNLIVRRAGPLATIQDLGRPQQRSAGISPGGALDLFAARVANLLVGNDENVALLEIAMGPAALQFADERMVAWCGAHRVAEIDSEEFFPGRAIRLRAGEELFFRPPEYGCRSWLAVSGGIEVPKILGSRSTDLRGQFGGLAGRALRDGDQLPLGVSRRFPTMATRTASWSAPNGWSQTALAAPRLRVVAGAEWEFFSVESRAALAREDFLVTPQTDRMAARLHGPALRRDEERELISEAVAPGTIQVANDHQPILLLGDCQTIGGYPKIAHVIAADLSFAAQLRPNDRVHFQIIDLAEARALHRQREIDLARFRAGLNLRQ